MKASDRQDGRPGWAQEWESRLWHTWVGLSTWLTYATQIGAQMLRGAYWIHERRRLFAQLGELYFQEHRGSTPKPEWASLMTQMDRLSKKLEDEEASLLAARAEWLAGKPQTNEDQGGTQE